MALEKEIEKQLQQRLTSKETQEEIDNKIRISVNKVLQQYFYHDKYDSDENAEDELRYLYEQLGEHYESPPIKRTSKMYSWDD